MQLEGVRKIFARSSASAAPPAGSRRRWILQELPAKNGIALRLCNISIRITPANSASLSTSDQHAVIEVVETLERVGAEHRLCPAPSLTKCLICKDSALTLVTRTETRNLAIDHFFESLAEDIIQRAIGVLLSGTGTDGTAGLRAIKATAA